MDVTVPPCAVDGCARTVYAAKSGLCRQHHYLLLKFGSPNVSVETVFDASVDKACDPDGCWLWQGGKSSAGYGRFRNLQAHRVAYERVRGPIPEGLEVDHMCHVRDCVNPDHLRLATSKQNKENPRGARSHSTNGIRGVVKNGNRWGARVRHHGRSIWVGVFDTPEAAGEAARLKRGELFTHDQTSRQAA